LKLLKLFPSDPACPLQRFHHPVTGLGNAFSFRQVAAADSRKTCTIPDFKCADGKIPYFHHPLLFYFLVA
jgi:hypothetical protein